MIFVKLSGSAALIDTSTSCLFFFLIFLNSTIASGSANCSIHAFNKTTTTNLSTIFQLTQHSHQFAPPWRKVFSLYQFSEENSISSQQGPSNRFNFFFSNLRI